MKKIFLIVILSFFYFFMHAQEVSNDQAAIKWRQQTVRINLAIKPQVEYVKIAGKMDFNASLSGIMTFNAKLFLGVYATKKPLRTFNDYSGTNYDASFQHLGFHVGHNLYLGLYRTEGGHYVKRKTKITYSLKLGGGLVWLVDENNVKSTAKDYFYAVQPNIGVTRPISTFIHAEIGVCYVAIFSIDKLDNYFSSTDFSGPGGYIAFKFNLFRE